MLLVCFLKSEGCWWNFSFSFFGPNCRHIFKKNQPFYQKISFFSQLNLTQLVSTQKRASLLLCSLWKFFWVWNLAGFKLIYFDNYTNIIIFSLIYELFCQIIYTHYIHWAPLLVLNERTVIARSERGILKSKNNPDSNQWLFFFWKKYQLFYVHHWAEQFTSRLTIDGLSN